MHVNDIYKHYKGNEYRIVGMSYCAEGENLIPRVEYEKVVPRKCIDKYIDNDEKEIRFSRSIYNFLEIIDTPEYNHLVPRFTFVRSG